MFDLGYKQIVINSDAVVKVVGAETIIEGFGKFETGKGENKFSIASSPAVAGVYAVTGPAATLAGDSYDVRIYFTGAPRILSEIFSGGGSNYSDSGQLMVRQSGVLGAADTLGLAMAASFIDGFDDSVIKISDDGANDFTITFQPGYEGLGVSKVTIIESKDYSSGQVFLDVATTTEGTEGWGNGKQVEAEVRNATFDNIDPYGIQFGGNTAVDVRGKYQTIKWEMPSDPATATMGWEPHADRGYGDAQTQASYGNVKYVAYVNEQAAAAIGLIAAI